MKLSLPALATGAMLSLALTGAGSAEDRPAPAPAPVAGPAVPSLSAADLDRIAAMVAERLEAGRIAREGVMEARIEQHLREPRQARQDGPAHAD